MNLFTNSAGFQILMLMMLAFATLAFTLLAMVTVSNAWRLRNPLLSWRAGKLYGYPLFASIFLGFSIFTSFVLYYKGESGMGPVMACYSWIALTWFFSSYQMSKRYITDNGIVKNVNDPSQTVRWSNIADFIEKQSAGGSIFVFFYMQSEPGASKKQMNRVELFVPNVQRDTFHKLLNYKLRRRFTQQSIYASGYEQFN
ncbi:MAG: hypothetical protein LAT57_10785 [Balneolales bacterium]|nr:hypothetical protein [Balneolales bacterium]